MNILHEIIERRREDIKTARRLQPAAALQTIAAQRQHRSLREKLLDPDQRTARIIAEIKRASPSAGMIRPDLSVPDLACEYRDHGATALSILTEPHYFMGSDTDIHAIRDKIRLPILRKDFIVDEYQVIETAAIGADVLLLIVAVLNPILLRDLLQTAVACGLETLIEVHDEKELDTILALDHPEMLIGVNSRNLKTLETDLSVAHRLADRIPAGMLAVAESGIRHATEIQALQRRGYRGFLVGESLLKSGNPGENLSALFN